jgi:hypothetical protein
VKFGARMGAGCAHPRGATMTRPADSMFDTLRTALARSHAGAAAILFLLAYGFFEALAVASLPFWGFIEALSTVMVHVGWLSSPLYEDRYPQLRVIALVLQLAKVAFFYFAARLLSHWVYRARPIQVLSGYRHQLTRKPHD